MGSSCTTPRGPIKPAIGGTSLPTISSSATDDAISLSHASLPAPWLTRFWKKWTMCCSSCATVVIIRRGQRSDSSHVGPSARARSGASR